MGSDDFCVKVRRIKACDSVSGAPGVNCGSSGGRTAVYDVTKAVDAVEGLSSHKSAQTRFLKCENQASNYGLSDISINIAAGNGNSACQLMSEELQSWKARKVPRTNFTSSKRARVSQIVGFTGTTAIDDFKDLFSKSVKRSISLVGKNDLVIQRSINSDKWAEMKVSKPLTKNKQEFTSVISSSTSFVTLGTNNVHGFYGLNSTIHDITQLVGNLSLEEMLDSAFFESPISSNKKTKEVVISNDSIVSSLRKACSVIQPLKPIKPLKLEGSCSENKMPTVTLGPVTMDEVSVDGDNSGDPTMNELSSGSKNHDNSGTADMQTSSLDMHIYELNELWDKLELVAATDLDSLLLDVSKLSIPSRSLSDLRLGKQVTKRGCLPLFTWSHAFNGIPRSNSDTAKLSASRNPCQARWVRIANSYSLSANNGDCYSDLDSIRYNKNLVPSVEGARTMPLSKIVSPESPHAPKQGPMPSSSVCPPASNDQCSDMDRHSPGVVDAAWTLQRMATSSPRGKPDNLLKWPREFTKKLSIGSTKPRSSKRPEEDSITTASLMTDRAWNYEQTLLKKPRISGIQLTHRKTSTSWSGPRSSRPSQIPPIQEFITSISKQPSLVIPASRVLDKAKAKAKAINGHKWPKRSVSLFWG